MRIQMMRRKCEVILGLSGKKRLFLSDQEEREGGGKQRNLFKKGGMR